MATILADDILKRIFLNENDRISIRISLKFVPRSPVNNKVALVLVMAWRRTGDKPLTEPMMTWFTDASMQGLVSSQWSWGLLSQFSPFRYFPIFYEWWKQWLPEWYQVHIWQVSPQLSCGDTWKIWTCLKVSNLYCYWIIISRNGEINALVAPTPVTTVV